MILVRKILLLLLLVAGPASADTIYKLSYNAGLDRTYPAIKQALEEEKLWVVFEPNMARTMANFAERWGKDYNRSGLEGLRSMVMCNAWYTNAVANADPDMLALCPISVTLMEKGGKSTALFARPSVYAQGSVALPIIEEIETKVIAALQAAAKQVVE